MKINFSKISKQLGYETTRIRRSNYHRYPKAVEIINERVQAENDAQAKYIRNVGQTNLI